MNKIGLLLIAVIAFLGQSVQAQSGYQIEIENKMNRFIELSNAGDWNTAFDMMYPKLFESVAKEELVAMMDQMKESGVDIKTNEHKIVSFSEVASTAEEDFVLVDYTANQSLKMGDEIMADETQRGAMIFNLESMFGKGKVSFDEVDKAFKIDASKSMYAISTAGKGVWYLVENNEEQKMLLDLLIPAEIQEKFKK